MNNKLIFSIFGILALGAIGTQQVFGQTVTLNSSTAKQIIWDKPTTNAQWAEDIKQENFDIKSTGKLNEMIAAQTAKLEREQKAFVKYQECPQCIYYEAKENLRNNYPDMLVAELESEARKQADTDIIQRQWEIEKIQQGIERMNNEIRMRKSGFIQVDGEERVGIFGMSVPSNRIRYIND